MASAEYQRQWRKKNREKVALYMRRWRAKYPSRARKYARDWVKNNPDKIHSYEGKESRKKYRREWMKADRLKHIEEYRAKDRKRKRINCPKRRRNHYLKNREKYLKMSRKYHLENPQIMRTSLSRRRAAIYGGAGKHTTAEWIKKLELHGLFCHYCQIPLTIKSVTRDHVVPLSRGGSDHIENIVPACPTCNSRKNSKTKEEFIAYLAKVD